MYISCINYIYLCIQSISMKDLNPFEWKACERPELRELLSLFYHLSISDIDAFFSICSLSPARVENVSLKMGKDKSTVQRCINKLYSAGLILRESRCCIEGKKGRFFVYQAVSGAELKVMLSLVLDKWYKKRQDVVGSL